MGIKAKDFLSLKKTNPISAYKQADRNGGNTMNAILDPQQLILKSGPRSAKEAAAAFEKGKAKMKKKKKGMGYKKGGAVKKMSGGGCCRGGGAATRGTKFSRSG